MNTTPNPWQATPPDAAGRWEMRCDETNQEPQTVLVFTLDGRLWVEDPDIGSYPLPHYHGGLCSIQWRKCEPVAEAAYRELLAMPVPQTANAFRQAIVMAVLIGRQIEADFQQQEPTNEPTCKTTHCPTWTSSPRNTKSAGQDDNDELP